MRLKVRIARDAKPHRARAGRDHVGRDRVGLNDLGVTRDRVGGGLERGLLRAHLVKHPPEHALSIGVLGMQVLI